MTPRRGDRRLRADRPQARGGAARGAPAWPAPMPIPARAEALAEPRRPGAAAALPRWQDAVTRADVDIVVVATTNDALAPVTLAAHRGRQARAGREAGGAQRRRDRSADRAARARGVRVRVGFNHRYHPALQKAREIVDSGALGPLMFIRGRYGHGGRVGYDREWRADPARSGGGELIDQGVHLIDLAALVSRRVQRRRRVRARPTSGTCRWTTTRS